MADLLDQTEDTSPLTTDIFYTVRDPLGSPLDRKVQIASLDTVLSATTKTLTNKTLTAPAISNLTLTGSVVEDVYDFGTPGATPTLEPANGTIQTITLSVNAVWAADAFVAGESVTVMVDDGTAYTLDWDTNLVDQWIGGAAPTLPTTGYTVVVVWKVGTTVYASAIGDMS
jgi:hypothetical protein